MKTIKDFKNGELKYDNTQNLSAAIKISLDEDVIEVDYTSIINTQFLGGNAGSLIQQLKNFLKLGIYSKAPCGGFVNFYRIISKKKKNYIVYSGVNEVSNSHYIVTIHKIIDIN